MLIENDKPRERDETLFVKSRREEYRMWRDLLVALFKSIGMFFQALWEFVSPRVPKDVTGQVAFITGGAKGLGREIALLLAKNGCNIAVVDIDIEGAKKTAAELRDLGVKAEAFKVDVSKAEEVDAVKGPVEEALGPVDIVINNAGVFFVKAIEDETPENLQRMMNINLMSNLYTTRTFLQGMIDRKRGHIASISSFAGLVGLATAVCYTTSKFGVRGFLEGLTIDLSHRDIHDVHVTGIFPYFIDTHPEVRQAVIEGCNHAVIIDPLKAAKIIVNGILCNEHIVTIPRNFYYLSYIMSAPMGLKRVFVKVLVKAGYKGPCYK